MFNAFVKVIPNVYSCKANVEFTIVCLLRYKLRAGVVPYISSRVEAIFALARFKTKTLR